jgi:hypothetical protein
MARLLIHVEGQTEEDFVNEILRDHLVTAGYHSVDARIIGNPRVRQRRGGIRPWPSVRAGIVNHLRQDSDIISTTMVDYYALPQTDPGDWPGRAQAASLDNTAEKAHCVETAVAEDIASAFGNASRFVPFCCDA